MKGLKGWNASILTPNSGFVARPMHPFKPHRAKEFRNFLQQSSPLNNSNTRNTRRKYTEKEMACQHSPEDSTDPRSWSICFSLPRYTPKFRLLARRYKTCTIAPTSLFSYNPSRVFAQSLFQEPRRLPRVHRCSHLTPGDSAPSGPQGDHSRRSQALTAETPQRRWRAIPRLWSLPHPRVFYRLASRHPSCLPWGHIPGRAGITSLKCCGGCQLLGPDTGALVPGAVMCLPLPWL